MRLRGKHEERVSTLSQVTAARIAVAPPPVASDAAEARVPSSGDADTSAPQFDETAEAAFLADARERGEIVAVTKRVDPEEDLVDPKALPSLEELVNRIPADVRDTLEDLFRAKFVAVRRVPTKALK